MRTLRVEEAGADLGPIGISAGRLERRRFPPSGLVDLEAVLAGGRIVEADTQQDAVWRRASRPA
jgi:hypothetical protein